MATRIGLLFVILLLRSALSLAQHSCPEGFRYVGTLSGTGSYGEFNEWRELTLPEGATLDISYQQTAVRARNGNASAKSNLTAADTPKGIHISAAGTTDFDKGWALSDPKEDSQLVGISSWTRQGRLSTTACL